MERMYKSALYDQIDKVPDLLAFDKIKLPPGQSFNIETGTLEETGGDRNMVNVLTGLAAGRVNCLLVAKNGQLVVEEYFNGYSAEDSQRIASAGKSIV